MHPTKRCCREGEGGLFLPDCGRKNSNKKIWIMRLFCWENKERKISRCFKKMTQLHSSKRRLFSFHWGSFSWNFWKIQTQKFSSGKKSKVFGERRRKFFVFPNISQHVRSRALSHPAPSSTDISFFFIRKKLFGMKRVKRRCKTPAGACSVPRYWYRPSEAHTGQNSISGSL